MNESLSLYPNPASGGVTIRPGNAVLEKNFSIGNSITVATGSWANGIYFVVVDLSNGSSVIQKLIVQN